MSTRARRRTRAAAAAACLLLASTLVAAPAAARLTTAGTRAAAPDTAALPDSGFSVERLAEGVYAVVRREPPAVINESNTLFVVGDRDVLVVDAQSSFARTRQTIAAIRAVTDKPVGTVVNTHWHDDHIFGNGVYRDSFPNVRFVGHSTSAQEMATTAVKYRTDFASSRAGTIGLLRGLVEKKQSFAGGPLSEEERLAHLSAARLVEDYGRADTSYRPPPPTVAVADRHVITQGRRRVEVLHLGRGHSGSDLVVHLPEEGILATGDLVMWPVTFVGTTSYPQEFAATLDRVLALKPRVIVPGHGPVLRDTAHAALVARMLHSLSAQAKAAVARGEPLDSARKSIRLDEFRSALVGDSPVRRILFGYYVTTPAVQRAYEIAKERK